MEGTKTVPEQVKIDYGSGTADMRLAGSRRTLTHAAASGVRTSWSPS